MTTGKAQIDFTDKLKTVYDDREAETISEWVFENVTGMKRWERRYNQNKDLEEDQAARILKYVEELLKHKPVQYVLNEAWFYKMKFFVNEDVLIPRPETEELVEWILSDMKGGMVRNSKQTNILDIGSGSGCISIALKKEFTHANITALDVCEKALKLSEKNARELKAEINFLQMDFLDESRWGVLSNYDIIVSNPPYITMNEKGSLAKNVVDFEPAIALFVDDNTPFLFYEKIAGFSKNHLNARGRLYLEIHEMQAEIIKGIFEKEGFVTSVRNDIYGKERMVRAVKSAG